MLCRALFIYSFCLLLILILSIVYTYFVMHCLYTRSVCCLCVLSVVYTHFVMDCLYTRSVCYLYVFYKWPVDIFLLFIHGVFSAVYTRVSAFGTFGCCLNSFAATYLRAVYSCSTGSFSCLVGIDTRLEWLYSFCLLDAGLHAYSFCLIFILTLSTFIHVLSAIYTHFV